MRRLLGQHRVPELPPFEALPQVSSSEDVMRLRSMLETHRQSLGTFLRRLLEFNHQTAVEVYDQLNTQTQGVGPPIASAATIKITHAIHPVTGTAAISTIMPPAEQRGFEADKVTPRYTTTFTGPVWLLVTANWSLTTGGNIMAAANPVTGDNLVVIYDGAKWWPARA